MPEKEPFDPAADVAGGDTSGGVASGLYGNAEAALVSGMPVPSLRVLQAAGAIRAQKLAKPHGGFRRTWPEEDVLKASIAAAIGEHFTWNIRIVAQVMAKTLAGTWDALVVNSVARLETPASSGTILIRDSDQDWHLDLVDRTCLFLAVPEFMTAILPDTVVGQTDLLLGMARKDGFTHIPWAFGSLPGRAGMKAALGPDGYPTMERSYRVAKVARRNAVSTAIANASMYVRRTSHRLHGREAFFVQDLIQPQERETDP